MTDEQKEKPLVSIIIPVFNVEKYLPACLDSVLNQTYKNIEVIIVNDGSTDKTRVICNEYACQDRRCIVIHQENAGQGDARNRAFNHVHGPFLMYIDGDDLIAATMVEELLTVQAESDADIVHCDALRVGKDSGTKTIGTKKRIASIQVFDSGEALNEYLYMRRFLNSPWAKLIRTELMNGLSFPTNMGYEDYAIMYRLYGGAGRIAYTSNKLYFYRQHDDSTMRRAFDERKIDRMKIADELKQYIEDYYPENCVALATRYCVAQMQVLMWLPFGKEYMVIKRWAFDNLKGMRGVCLGDNQAPTLIRIMLVASYLGVNFTMLLGRLYRVVTRQ